MPTYSGSIASAAESDSFTIRLRAGQQYMISADGGFVGLSDPTIEVRRGGRVIARDDDSGPGLDPELFLVAGQTGVYRIDVSGYGSSTGSYTLSVLEDDFRNEFDGAGRAGAVAAGGGRAGRIDYDDDIDVVGVTLIDGLTYDFDLRGNTLSDPRLGLRSASGTALDFDDDSGEGYDSHMTFTADRSGKHFLEAMAYGSATGTYRLSVSEGRGTAGGDRVRGTSAGDAVDGLGGDDRIAGAGGNDRLLGGDGDDRLAGQAGADTLLGGAGADSLIGGAGADRFVFALATDQQPGARDALRAGDGAPAFQGAGAAAGDCIVLAGIDADATAAGNQAFAFGQGPGPGGLWAVDAGGNTLIRGNLDGDAEAELEILIVDGAVTASAYTADDFVL
jgi:Ca2+-binding RTX toxin-like protein